MKNKEVSIRIWRDTNLFAKNQEEAIEKAWQFINSEEVSDDEEEVMRDIHDFDDNYVIDVDIKKIALEGDLNE